MAGGDGKPDWADGLSFLWLLKSIEVNLIAIKPQFQQALSALQKCKGQEKAEAAEILPKQETFAAPLREIAANMNNFAASLAELQEELKGIYPDVFSTIDGRAGGRRNAGTGNSHLVGSGT